MACSRILSSSASRLAFSATSVALASASAFSLRAFSFIFSASYFSISDSFLKRSASSLNFFSEIAACSRLYRICSSLDLVVFSSSCSLRSCSVTFSLRRCSSTFISLIKDSFSVASCSSFYSRVAFSASSCFLTARSASLSFSIACIWATCSLNSFSKYSIFLS